MDIQFPIEKVTWIDASRLKDSGWIDMCEIADPDPPVVISIGYVVRENSIGIVVVPTIADIERPENQHVFGGMLIPVCAIKSRVLLS